MVRQRSHVVKQRSHTDETLQELTVWPDGLVVDGVPLTSKDDLADMLNEFRASVTTLSVDFHDVIDFYSDITTAFIHWLLVICCPLFSSILRMKPFS